MYDLTILAIREQLPNLSSKPSEAVRLAPIRFWLDGAGKPGYLDIRGSLALQNPVKRGSRVCLLAA